VSRPLFAVLAIGAVALLAALAVARNVGGSSASPDSLLPFLVAAAALCVAGLTVRRHPTAAWLALILGLSTTTLDLAAYGREQRAVVTPDAWRWISIAIVLAAIASTSAAAAYAADPAHRLGRWVVQLACVAVAAVFAIGVWALATPDPALASVGSLAPLGDVGLVTRAFLFTTTALTSLGLLGDIRPAAYRASMRLAVTRDRHPTGADQRPYAIAWLHALVDELTPGRTQERRAAMAERARLARDLHAVVVPDLRQAIREAERVGSVDRLARSLRDALRQIEAMMEARDAIGLEIGGLVPALESLAERTEERTDVRVTIDVVDDVAHGAGSPPRDVQAAALRVATLAIDNVTRHAPKAAVRVSVATGAESVRITIEDDGPGVPSDAGRSPDAGRRLRDMATEAALCGGRLRSGRGERGIGTLVAFDWPAD
jgi:signal transduction histidine kinase